MSDITRLPIPARVLDPTAIENAAANADAAERARIAAETAAARAADEVAPIVGGAVSAALAAQAAAETAADRAASDASSAVAPLVDSAVAAQEQAQIAAQAASDYQAAARTLATWSALAALTGAQQGEGAEVLDADTGTHTDPVAGGTVQNGGRYSWSVSPAGWRRVGDTGLSAKAAVADVRALDARKVGGRRRAVSGGAYAVAFIDPSGAVALGIDERGRTHLQRSTETIGGGLVGAGRQAWAASGKIVFGIRRDGFFATVSPSWLLEIVAKIRGVSVTGLVGAALWNVQRHAAGVIRFDADIAGVPRGYLQRDGVAEVVAEAGGAVDVILTSGQSTDAADIRSGPKVLTSINYPGHALMFQSGIRGPQNSTALTASAFDRLVPAAEVASGNNGETGGAAMLRLLTEDRRAARLADVPTIYRCHGVNGYRLDQLDKANNSGPYRNNVLAAQSAARIAGLYGKSAITRAVYWSQGHADQATDPVSYETALAQLAADYDADIRAATGQTVPVRFVMDPPATGSWGGHIGGGYPATLAQYRLQRDNPLCVISTPAYFMRFGDGIHYLAEWYGIRGEYRAKVHRALERGEAWTPLRPASVTRVGAVITVALEGGVGNLVVDTTVCPEQPNLGFAYRDDSSSAAIEAVSVDVAARTITIALTDIPSGDNPRLYYAWLGTGTGGALRSGAMGNIRDSDQTPSRMGVDGYPTLPNWLISFEEHV